MGSFLALALTFAAEPRVTMKPPQLVASGPLTERRWGRWQFPVLETGPGNKLLLFVHVEQDSAAAYGKKRRVFVSGDHGKHWQEGAGDNQPYGLRLPNGEWLRTDTVAATPVASVQLPRQIAERISYSTPFQLYRLLDLPETLRRIFFQRFRDGAWQPEHQTLDDPHALRYATGGLIPQIWWGDMKALPNNGGLVALTYPYYHDSQPVPYTSAAAYRSRDHGHTWTKTGHILYDEPDRRRDGFTEPALEILRDGSLFAVLRTTDGNGIGPMYKSRSTDGGATWSKPEVFTETGVLPRLLQLANGVLVLSSGRPGVDLRFSRDGGATWTAPRTLVPVPDPGKPQADSCGYTSLVPLGRDRFLIAYSWFTPPSGAKSIFVREVRVQ